MVKYITYVASKDFTLQELIISNQVWQPSVFFKRKIFDEIGYLDESYHYIMDYDFWIRIATRYNIGYINSTLARFRLHGQSKTVSNSDLFLIQNLIMLDRLLHKYEHKEAVEKPSFFSIATLLPKFLFNHPLPEIQKYQQKHCNKIINEVQRLADYRSL